MESCYIYHLGCVCGTLEQMDLNPVNHILVIIRCISYLPVTPKAFPTASITKALHVFLAAPLNIQGEGIHLS